MKMRRSIRTFDSSDFGPLRARLEGLIADAVKALHKDLEVKVGNITYDSLSARAMLRIDIRDRPDPNFDRFLERYQLDPDMVTEGYKLRGYDPSRKRKPVLVKKVRDGHVAATSVKLAKTMFGKDR